MRRWGLMGAIEVQRRDLDWEVRASGVPGECPHLVSLGQHTPGDIASGVPECPGDGLHAHGVRATVRSPSASAAAWSRSSADTKA